MGQSETAVEHFMKLLQGENGAFLDDFALAFEVRRPSVCLLNIRLMATADV